MTTEQETVEVPLPTQLIQAATINDHAKVEELLDDHPNAFFRSVHGGFAMYHAILEGHAQSAQMLLDLYLQFHEAATKMNKETQSWDEVAGYTITDTARRENYNTLALILLVKQGLDQKADYDAIRMAMLNLYLAIDNESIFWDEKQGPFVLSKERAEQLVNEHIPMLGNEAESILKTSTEFDWNRE